VSALEIIGLFVAGIGAGLTGSIAGLASLVSYPALLAVGLPAVTANVTNTVALIFSSVGSVSGSMPELEGQAPRMRRLVPVAAAGGVAGGILLLVTPSGDFKRIVPWLIGLASLAMLLRRRALPVPAAATATTRRWGSGEVGLAAVVFCIAVYGGYFGAAAGVILLAALLLATTESLARASAAKNLILGVANGLAAVLFVVASSVRWSAALPLAVGLLLGGRLGPIVVRRSPARPLQLLIAAAGLGLAVYLGVAAYH
jgi:uncharacterized membrane protein YfcA